MPPPKKPHRLWAFPWPTFAGFATATTSPPPDWGNRIGWTAIVASTFYFVVRIVPAFISGY
jgi:hypothetical protein